MPKGQMKSSVLISTKARSESKPYCQRRRFTKTAAAGIVNGEYDPDLALAIQESLKQAEIDALKAKQMKKSGESKLELEASKENRYKTSSSTNMTMTMEELGSETKQLKDLVSVHMDLVQKQQEIINQKDKTIKSLKAENSALQCRLQRMERRMSLLKQREEMSHSPHIAHSPPPKPGTMSYTEPIVTPAPDKTSRIKKQEAPTPTKRWSQDKEANKPSPLKSVGTAEELNSPLKNKRESHRKRKLASSEETESESKYLRTNNLYHVCYYEPESSDIDLEPRPDIMKSAQSQREVEVPTFRIKTYTNLYIIEGTEDHEDETFVRRHQKPEIEEKRRKRWDNQRQREETMYEKLREKYYPNEKYKKPEDPIESFYPNLEEITHIEVMDKIPVTAFGHAIPYVKQEDFLLPWNPRQHSSHRLRHK